MDNDKKKIVMLKLLNNTSQCLDNNVGKGTESDVPHTGFV